ncbi:hypothetical protein UO65_0609 [Actinokineospora spheciospongiae]|uniref:SnoaL-like domain-containing protein n=1 Tax=Actinokineospora spheciospongiae TaxID=909613 RepID=W7J4Z3_9PSEU|nr:nuclear transport factor 2 family protein [Actinokineospora spheciospongiae]EWC64082.1 hypothetical protein UO65_0609 [Actinokineospora spheciospongiae]
MTQNNAETRVIATEPEQVARLFVERFNAGDAEGLAELYEPDAVMAYPPGARTEGRAAIRAVCAEMMAHIPELTLLDGLPAVRNGDLALTSTRSADDTPGRVQLVRRQPDGRWLRVLDRPEAPHDI